jgi:hypothetical protein
MTLAGIELNYLVNKISEEVQGYYVSNIWGALPKTAYYSNCTIQKNLIFL